MLSAMKKFLAILVLSLLFINPNAIAGDNKFKSKDIKGFKKIRKNLPKHGEEAINQALRNQRQNPF